MMIRTAVVFFVLAMVAFGLGAYGIAGISMEVGKILVGAFLILAVLSFVVSFFTGKEPRHLI